MQNSTEDYQPGRCNIGSREVSVRRKCLTFFILLTALSTAWFFFYPTVLTWIVLVLITFASIVLVKEIKCHFCILFGFFGLYNFRELGNLNEVQHKPSISRDRKRVAEILIRSFLYALIFAGAMQLIHRLLL